MHFAKRNILRGKHQNRSVNKDFRSKKNCLFPGIQGQLRLFWPMRMAITRVSGIPSFVVLSSTVRQSCSHDDLQFRNIAFRSLQFHKSSSVKYYIALILTNWQLMPSKLKILILISKLKMNFYSQQINFLDLRIFLGLKCLPKISLIVLMSLFLRGKKGKNYNVSFCFSQKGIKKYLKISAS